MVLAGIIFFCLGMGFVALALRAASIPSAEWEEKRRILLLLRRYNRRDVSKEDLEEISRLFELGDIALTNKGDYYIR